MPHMSILFHLIPAVGAAFLVVHAIFMVRSATQQFEKDGWWSAATGWSAVLVLEGLHLLLRV